MGRKPRVEYAGALYHVMCRGNRCERIFQDDEDRQVFLDTLGEVCERTGWRVCAYVLMPNHYHWVLETPEANLVAGMKWFQGTYTKRHNFRHREWGHLFQGRYKSIVIDPGDAEYFRTACDYVHLNPVRASLAGTEATGDLGVFFWSSSRYLMNSPQKDPLWLSLDRIVEAHGQRPDGLRSRKAYLRYLGNRAGEEKDDSDYGALRRGWCLGSSEFKEELRDGLLDKQMGSVKRDSIVGEPRRMHDHSEAERLLNEAVGVLDFELSKKNRLKRNDVSKELIAWFLSGKTSVGQEWIAQKLGMGNRVNVSRAIRHIEDARDGVKHEGKRTLEEMFKCLH